MQITYKYINCGHYSYYAQPDIMKALDCVKMCWSVFKQFFWLQNMHSMV